jgi:5'-deoxy-5'-methylthioadenosine phosphorylase
LSEFSTGDVLSEGQTVYGRSSAPVLVGVAGGCPFAFLARHGSPHKIPPHKINYRANIKALHTLGVKRIVAVNAVGGINSAMRAGDIVLPTQLIDYTYGREHTFSDSADVALEHIDFSFPFTPTLVDKLASAAVQLGLLFHRDAVYGVTQGPRLETAAEIDRMERDGCDIVGMTAMPEAALAAELGMEYASINLVVNPAAGRSDGVITMDDIHAVLESGIGRVRSLLNIAIPQL